MKALRFTATTAAIAALLLAAWATGAHAARPMVADEADPLAQRDCEWDLYRMRARSGDDKANAWTTQLGCGVSSNTQVNVAFSRSRANGFEAEALALNGKTALVAREGSQWGIGLSYGWLGGRIEESSFRTDSTFVNLLFTKAITPSLVGHANIGRLNEKGFGKVTTWNLAAEWTVREGIDLVGDVFGDSGSDPWVGVGVRWALSDNANINASYAVQREEPQIKLISVGVKLAF